MLPAKVSTPVFFQSPIPFPRTVSIGCRTLACKSRETIRIWPSGLPARGWDGEGTCEWLTTETPSFGITHDHPVSGYSLSLNDGELFQIRAGETGSPTYIQLDQLPAGQHRLAIKANHGYRAASARFHRLQPKVRSY